MLIKGYVNATVTAGKSDNKKSIAYAVYMAFANVKLCDHKIIRSQNNNERTVCSIISLAINYLCVQ